MTLARYPNDGYTYITKVYEAGRYDDKNTNPDAEMVGMEIGISDDRISNWVNAKEPWIFGYWYFDWSDTVSYTHLDVYKRQPQFLLCWKQQKLWKQTKKKRL